MQRAALCLALLAGCSDEPSYEGLLCDLEQRCPLGYRCSEGSCTARVVGFDAGEDAGELPPKGDAGDAGDPVLARCDDPVTYPSDGWEARHFTLGPNATFDECFGVEEVLGDDLDRDYENEGPLDGAHRDFGSRYTATRTFEAGVHTFLVTHDDGIRIRIDGDALYEHWIHEYLADVRVFSGYLSAGPHQLEIEHFDDEGFAQLDISWERGCIDPAPVAGQWVLSYHEYDPDQGALIYEHCYGLETVSSTALDSTGPPPLVAAQGATENYGIVGKSLHTFRGKTAFWVEFDDGFRLWIDGEQVIDRWEVAPPTDSSGANYLPGTYSVEFEKFATTNDERLAIEWEVVCELRPPSLALDEWWATFYRVTYSASPESWTLDRNDCLGEQIVAGAMFTGSGVPTLVDELGIDSLWGGEFFAERDFGSATTVNLLYDDGLRIFDGGAPIFESWTAPQVGMDSISVGAGSHSFRLEYFQNLGGAQLNFTW